MHKPLLLSMWLGVLFLVWFNNFDRTMNSYQSYTLLLELYVCTCSWRNLFLRYTGPWLSHTRKSGKNKWLGLGQKNSPLELLVWSHPPQKWSEKKKMTQVTDMPHSASWYKWPQGSLSLSCKQPGGTKPSLRPLSVSQDSHFTSSEDWRSSIFLPSQCVTFAV